MTMPKTDRRCSEIFEVMPRGMALQSFHPPSVTPAQAGAYLEISGWVPAFAGMTPSVWLDLLILKPPEGYPV